MLATMVTSALAVGRAQFELLLTPEGNPVGRQRLKRFTQHVSTKGLRLLYPGHDLGYLYPTPMQMLSSTMANHAKTPGDPVPQKTAGTYVPRLVPGARLPHADVAIATASNTDGVQSTLDLVNVLHPGQLLLLVWGPAGAALAEQRLGAVCVRGSPYHFVPVVLGGDAQVPRVHNCEEAIVGTWYDRGQQGGSDGQEPHPFTCGAEQGTEATAGGVTLVRPDGYICWAEMCPAVTDEARDSSCDPSGCPSSSEQQLRAALHMMYRE
eukprot:m.676620 g.676620  ORF g.676620 m.676620 type:complete len:266 (-) comp22791_c0_seq16:406-1203(-)